jgi:hypothetical protein
MRTQVLAIELGLDRVHQHARRHVVDKDIFLAAVAQCLERRQGGALGVKLIHRAGGGRLPVVLDDTGGQFDRLAHAAAALVLDQAAFG